jgi:hypothetical protein
MSSLRQLLVRVSLTGAVLEMSGKASFCFQRTSLDVVIGEVPMATWMQTFLALHANRLPQELRTTMLQMQLGWHAYEKQLQQQAQAALAQTIAESVLLNSLPCSYMCKCCMLAGLDVSIADCTKLPEKTSKVIISVVLFSCSPRGVP